MLVEKIVKMILKMDNIIYLFGLLITICIPYFKSKVAYWNRSPRGERWKQMKIPYILLTKSIIWIFIWKLLNEGLSSYCELNKYDFVNNFIFLISKLEQFPFIMNIVEKGNENKWKILMLLFFLLHFWFHEKSIKDLDKKNILECIKEISNKIMGFIISVVKKERKLVGKKKSKQQEKTESNVIEMEVPESEGESQKTEPKETEEENAYTEKILKWTPYEKKLCFENNVYVLKKEYMQVRKLYKYLFQISAIVVFFAAWILDILEMNIEDSLGGFGTLIILMMYFMEQYNFYNGYTEDEYRIIEERKCNQKLLKQNDFSDVMPDYLHKDLVLQYSRTDKINKINNLCSSQEYRKKCLGMALRDIINDLPNNTDFIDAAIKLIEYQSVYFSTPFYHDIGPYIFPFLNLELLENKKILVLTGTSDRNEQLKEWFSLGLKSKYGYLEFWDVENMSEDTRGVDIGIVPLGSMNKIVLNNESIGFWQNISTVIFFEPSCFLPYNPVIIPQILDKIKTNYENITYIVCDMNVNGMVDILSDILKVNFIYVNATQLGNKCFYKMCEADIVSDENIFKDVRAYFANEMQEVANIKKYILGKMHWYGSPTVPIWDIKWEVGQYYKLFAKMTKDTVGMDSIYELLDFQEDGNEARVEKKAISLVEDYLYNVCEFLRQYETRGEVTSCIAVFSCNYMLRDFMMDNAQEVIDNGAKRIAQRMPRFQYSFRNFAIAIASRILKGGISFLDAKRLCHYYGVIEYADNIKELILKLNDFYKEVLEISDVLLEEYYWDEEEDERCKKIVFLTEKGRINFEIWYKHNIDIVLYNNETTEKGIYINTLASGHVYQYYLPGQFVVFEGKYYVIKEITEFDGHRNLILQRTADSCKERKYYRQMRVYKILKWKNPYKVLLKRKDLEIQMGEVDIEVSTEGYLCGSEFNAIWKADKIQMNTVPIRKYCQKKILKIDTRKEDVLFPLFLKEILYTLFPRCWQLLSISMINIEGLQGYIDLFISNKKMYSDYKNKEIYIIEDSPMDLGLLDIIYEEFDNILVLFEEYKKWGAGRGKAKVKQFWGEMYEKKEMENVFME